MKTEPFENDTAAKNNTTRQDDGATSTTYTPGSLSDVTWFSKFITYYFVGPLVDWAANPHCTEINIDHLWDIPSTEEVKHLVAQFDEKRKSGEDSHVTPGTNSNHSGRYYDPLLSVGMKLILTGAFFMLLRTLAEVFLPLIVREIIDHVDRQDFNGIYYVLAFFLNTGIGQFSNQVHMRCMEVAANRLRAVSNFVIFRHALTLRSCAQTDGMNALSDVVTLVASDTQRFVDVYAHFHLLWASPLQIILGSYYLVQFISYPGLIAVGVMMALYPYSVFVSKLQGNERRKMLPLTQQRVLQISEYLQGVRVVKMYGWEKFLVKVIHATRAQEIACLTKELLLFIANVSFLVTIPQFALCFTFLVYIQTEGSLSAKNAFAALSMLILLKFPVMFFGNAIMMGSQLKVGCDRIEAFLNSSNVVRGISAAAETVEDGESVGEEDAVVHVVNSTFSWNDKKPAVGNKENASANEPVPSEEELDNVDTAAVAVADEQQPTIAQFSLNNLNLKLRRGECCAILGAVGAGKTMASLSLLQETFQQSGSMVLPQTVAYASQEPYLMSGTVRDNILFFRDFDETRYRTVLEACQLWQDLDAYTDGEMTIVGERGITLSGGQKARIALARAAYADDAPLVILDDPFSALDARTGKLVLEALLSRPDGLLRKQAVVLVTHARGNLWAADHLLELSEGDIAVSPSSPSADACYGDTNQSNTPADTIRDSDKSNALPPPEKRELAGESKNKLVSAEQKEGTVAFRTYWDFFKWGGGATFACSVFIALLFERISFSSGDVWLAIWTSAEHGKPTHTIGQKFDFPAGDHYDGARFYLRVYAVIICITHCLNLTRLGSMAFGGVRCSRALVNAAFEKLTKCPMEWFDSTPTGRILNRMSHDVERMGFMLISQQSSMYATCAWLLTGIIVVAIVVPYNLFVVVPAVATMFYLLYRFRAVNVHLQRLDAVARSDLQSHIFESVTGAVSIRCFGRTSQFLDRCQHLIDTNTKTLYAVAMCQRWVAMRAESLGVLMSSFICLMVWVLRDSISGGLAGIAIVWGMNSAKSITFAITDGVQGEAKLVSVERLVDYVENLPEEPARVVEATQPSAEWPEKGRIEFRNACMRYREGLPLVLDNCSFDIKAGSRVGIVGRTGSGKSSTVVALFRLRELVGGSIFIDDVDIGSIGLDGLRGGRIAIIPQDPVLFSGTIRTNVDPFDQYSDDEVVKSLEAVTLWNYITTIGGLGAVVGERGKNFSVGQRQLICISRALLRNPRVLLMDEATANVDNETDLLIQRAVRDLFQDTTVVEIAHRLHTVMDADQIIVMSSGSVVETGTPHDLCQQEDGVFSSMVEATGEAVAQELRDVALKASSSSSK